jgi:hypothetical protein
MFSTQGRNVLDATMWYLNDEYRAKHGGRQLPQLKEWTDDFAASPIQTNGECYVALFKNRTVLTFCNGNLLSGVDCGVFMLVFVTLIASDRQLFFRKTT